MFSRIFLAIVTCCLIFDSIHAAPAANSNSTTQTGANAATTPEEAATEQPIKPVANCNVDQDLQIENNIILGDIPVVGHSIPNLDIPDHKMQLLNVGSKSFLSTMYSQYA